MFCSMQESMSRGSMYVLCTGSCQNGCFIWRVTWNTWLQRTGQEYESETVNKAIIRLFVMRCLTWTCAWCVDRHVYHGWIKPKGRRHLKTYWNWDSWKIKNCQSIQGARPRLMQCSKEKKTGGESKPQKRSSINERHHPDGQKGDI